MSYKIRLPQFEGPIELLLYFVRKDRIDIMDIPISKIADEFYEYTRKINPERESYADFLLMTAILLRMKVRALLNMGYEEDIKEDVSQKITLSDIIEQFAKYKKTQEFLRRKELENLYLLSRVPAFEEPKKEKAEDPFKLLEIFKKLLEKNKEKTKTIYGEKYSFEEVAAFIKEKLNKHKKISFLQIVREKPDFEWLISVFWMILILAKNKEISLHQENYGEDIKIIKSNLP